MAEEVVRRVSAFDFYGNVGDAISIDPDTGEEFHEGEPEPQPDDDLIAERGGPGSGHFEHAGRPGERGGSLPGDASTMGEEKPGSDEMLHRWEVAGLGARPYRLVDFWQAPSRALLEANPSAYNAGWASHPGTTSNAFGACEYCGTGITGHYIIESADKKRFCVGSECVRRTEEPALISALKRYESKNRDEAKRLKRVANREEGVRLIGQFEDVLKGLPHPHAGMAASGRTLYDYYHWGIAENHFGDAGIKAGLGRIKELASGMTQRGGPGSGHFGHEGRPGEQGGSLPGYHDGFPVVFDASLKSEGEFRDNKILIGPKFFDLPDDGRQNVLDHEAGHAVSDQMLADGRAFKLQDAGAFTGLFDGHEVQGINGHITPGENAAEAYAVYKEDPAWLAEHYPLAYEAMAAYLINRGGPGSGHFGHEGRPGERGGSLPGEATATGEVSSRHEHTPVAAGETLPDELPFPTYAGGARGFSTDTFTSVYADVIGQYGGDTAEGRYAAEVIRWMMEEQGKPVTQTLATRYQLNVDVARGINATVENMFWKYAEENEDEAYLRSTATSEDDEPEAEAETEPMPEFEASIQQAADGLSEAMTDKFLAQKFGIEGDEIWYLKAYVTAIARGRELPTLRESGVSLDRARKLQGMVQEYLTTLDQRYQESREHTGDLNTVKAEADDLVLVSRELESEEWQNDAMSIASAAIYKSLQGSEHFAGWDTTVLRDGSNPVALLMTEDMDVPMTTLHADFSPEVIDKLVPEGNYLYVHYVASEERGKGYGTYLMTKALQTASAKGQGIMGGSVPEATAFYEKLGAKFVANTAPTSLGEGLSLAYLSPEQVATLYQNMGSPVLKALIALLPEDEPVGPMFVSPSILALARERHAKRNAPVTPVLRRLIIKGGPGSGHFGHAGRPGAQGGSLPGEVSQQHEPGILGRLGADRYKDMPEPSEERLHTAGLRAMAQGSETSKGIDKPTMTWAFTGMQDIARRWLEYNDKTGKVDREGRPYNDYVAERFKKDLAAIGDQPSYENLLAIHDALWHAVQGQNPTVSKGPDMGRPNLAAAPGSGRRVVKYTEAEIATPGPHGETTPWTTANHGWHLFKGGRGRETWTHKAEWEKEHGLR